MRTITLYREDFKKWKQPDSFGFESEFDLIIQRLKHREINSDEICEIDEIEMAVDSFKLLEDK